jgi:hypothetical protein
VNPLQDPGIQDAPILVDLRQRLEAASDPAERSALRIRQGLYMARTNRMAEAEAIPAEIREVWAGQEDLRVFVWLWILEGVLAFYQTSRTDQRDRLRQAQAVAERSGLLAEFQLASAWLAHLAYVDSDYDGMVRHLRAAGLGAGTLVESVARSALTLACALQLCGDEPLAASWFARAREVARRAGDRAGIMAATANRLMLRLNDNWLCLVFGEVQPHDAVSLRQELLGILGYERLSGSESLTEQNEMAQLRLAMIRGDDAAALATLRGLSAARDRRSAPSLATAAVVEHWLLARAAHDPAVAQQHWEAVRDGYRAEGLDDDDQAACLALMAKTARAAGCPNEADDYWRLALAARARFRAGIDAVRPGILAVEADASAHWPHG